MAQFDVYRNPNEASLALVPYLLDVQADVLGDLATRVVVPLVAASVITKAATRLNPIFHIEGTTVVMSTAELAGYHAAFLTDRVCSLKDHRSAIIAALDFLFTGF